MRPEILAVSRLPDSLLGSLDQRFSLHRQTHETDPVAFGSIAGRIRGVVVGGKFTLPRELIDRLPALEIASVVGAGYDGVDVAAAVERNILVTHTPVVHASDVADFAMGLVLSLRRRIPQADQFVREGRWRSGLMPFASAVSGSRLGLVGMGHVGVALAARARAFNMAVAYTARTEKPELPYRFHAKVADLAAQVDFLVLAACGGAATRHIVNAEVLDALGPEGHLVNVARGSLIDQGALIEALRKQRIAGAALDVFEGEPNVHPDLVAMPNVILTPHIASATNQTRQAMFDLTMESLCAHFEGARPAHLIPECSEVFRTMR